MLRRTLTRLLPTETFGPAHPDVMWGYMQA